MKCNSRDKLEGVRSFHTRSTISQNEFSFLDQFCCESESRNNHCFSHRSLVVYCTRSPVGLDTGADAKDALMHPRVFTAISYFRWTKVRWECVDYCPFLPSNTTPVIIPSVKTPNCILCELTTCWWYQPFPFALIPEVPSMFPSSSFQDMRGPFPTCCLCTSLGHLCSHSWFLWTIFWIFLGFFTLSFA